MNKEEMMEKAYRDYPVGTKYKSPTPRGCELIYTVEEQNFKWINESIIWGEEGKECLYYDGRWAEIVDLPKKELFLL